MKMFSINGNFVTTDIRQSTYPIKVVSRSRFQHKVGEILQEIFPFSDILEDFCIPESRLSVDFFIPKKRIVIEVSPRETHAEHTDFFHGSKFNSNFPNQMKRDSNKANWAEINKFDFIEISDETELYILDNIRKKWIL